MKLYDLKETNYARMPGPGDYHPGDEDIPGSPDYDPRPRNRGSSTSSYVSPEEARDNARRERDEETRKYNEKEAKRQEKISDVEYSEDFIHGKGMAPVTTMTGSAIDRDAAQREINRVRYVAWNTYEDKIEELPNGRFKYMIKYMM